MAPHTSCSTSFSFNNRTRSTGNGEEKTNASSATSFVPCRSTILTSLATSNTGAITSFHTEKAAFIFFLPASRAPFFGHKRKKQCLCHAKLMVRFKVITSNYRCVFLEKITIWCKSATYKKGNSCNNATMLYDRILGRQCPVARHTLTWGRIESLFTPRTFTEKPVLVIAAFGCFHCFLVGRDTVYLIVRKLFY